MMKKHFVNQKISSIFAKNKFVTYAGKIKR